MASTVTASRPRSTARRSTASCRACRVASFLRSRRVVVGSTSRRRYRPAWRNAHRETLHTAQVRCIFDAMSNPGHTPRHLRMGHREILESLSGLLLVLFVAMISSTIVSTALPRIVGELNGTQTQYTWVVTATL